MNERFFPLFNVEWIIRIVRVARKKDVKEYLTKGSIVDQVTVSRLDNKTSLITRQTCPYDPVFLFVHRRILLYSSKDYISLFAFVFSYEIHTNRSSVSFQDR